MNNRCEYARRIGCKVNELPVMETSYYPRVKKNYPIYNPIKNTAGVFNFDGKNVVVQYQKSYDDSEQIEAKSLNLTTWHEDLMSLGFFMLPTIFRSGACVCYNNRVACIVPPVDADVSDGNFNSGNFTYSAIVAVNECVDIPVIEALQTLLPIGQRLYLDYQFYPDIIVSDGDLLQVQFF